jgi:hypothetical protein
MIPKLIAAFACVILLIALGASGLRNVGTQKKAQVKWEDKHSLKEIARRSKAEGKGAIKVPGSWFDYPGRDMTLDKALSDYTVVVAEMMTSKSYPFESRGVRTWYKFKIKEALSEKYANPCSTCPEIPDVPEDLSPVNYDEFVFPTSGGTVNVDGVDVTVDPGSEPVFESGKKYLLVVSLAPSRVALMGAGPSGIFQVNEDDRLEAADKASPMQAEITRRFAGSLAKLRTHLDR